MTFTDVRGVHVHTLFISGQTWHALVLAEQADSTTLSVLRCSSEPDDTICTHDLRSAKADKHNDILRDQQAKSTMQLKT